MAQSVLILSLNDDCLVEIATYVTDYKSFYSFALTCKRFHKALQSVKVCKLPLPVVNRMLKFCLLKFVIQDWIVDGKVYQENEYPTIDTLIQMVKIYNLMNPFYDLMVRVWKDKGPLACSLLTYIQDVNYKCGRFTKFGNTVFKQEKTLILKLPKSRKTLRLLTFNDGESLYLRVFFDGFRNTSITPKCLNNVAPEMFEHWSKDDIKKIVDPFRSVIKFLQKEIGKKMDPISDRLYLWLMFFPDSLEFSALKESSQTESESFSRNEQFDTKPTRETAERVIQTMNAHNSLLLRVGQSVYLERVTDILCEKLPRYKLEVLDVFMRSCLNKMILYETDSHFRIPKTLSLNLFMRIKHFPCCGSLERKDLYFHGTKGNGMEVTTGFETRHNPSRIPSYLIFKFGDKTEAIFSHEEIQQLLCLRSNSKLVDKTRVLLMLQKLAPFTEFVKECFGEVDLGRDKITDFFVAVFFLELLLS